ncbi:MAG TPA: DinB family protein [Saprospiraceae bacterium]|nr:DinB family protein [Saprospiraceae bacterium]
MSRSVLFLCLIGCFLFQYQRSEAQTSFLSDFKIKWKNAANYTLEFAGVMPEDNYGYTPTKVEMTYREQLKHVAGNIVWLCNSFLDGNETTIDPAKTGDSKKEVIALLERSFKYADETIGKMTEKDLEENVDFLAGKMSKRRILFLLSDHVTHHRGQLVVYLRMKNITPPDYVGW